MAGAALVRDRASLVTGGVLVIVALAAWLELIAQPQMPMAVPGFLEAAAFVGAWGVMMVAMMLPSAVPMISLYGVVWRNAARAGQRALPEGVFALVYIAVWAAVGAPVYVASLIVAGQRGLDDVLPYALAVVLVLAGVYQLTPLKRACLRVCRSPLSFFMARSRTGYAGSLTLAFEHAAYCLGCCWGLMVVLVAAGAMALNWVLLIAAIVFLEKVLPHGERSALAVGGALVLLGAAVATHPELATVLRPTSTGM